MSGDEEPDLPVPGYRNYIIYTDESGMHGGKYYGFGSLWIPWERRGDLVGQIRSLREKHRVEDELKWTNVKRRSAAFVLDVVSWFFERPWMMFHCILVANEDVNRTLHKGRDEAQQKHFSMLLKNKIGYFASGGGKRYRLRVDPLPSGYDKADEVVQKIVNAQLSKEIGEPLVHDVVTCDSKRTVGIQVADVLLGAVIAAWQGAVEAEAKKRVMLSVAEHLGWADLRHDTNHSEWKFNIWHFHDPVREKRKAETLPVKLKYPMPAFRPRRPRRRVSGVSARWACDQLRSARGTSRS